MDFVNGQLYNLIKDITTLLITAAGLLIASIGLYTWKKQIKGTKEFETFYTIHYSVLKLRDAIKHVRNPAIWNEEFAKASEWYTKKYPERSGTSEIEENSAAYVYEMRWDEITKASTEVESHLLAAEVLWGDEITNTFKPLKKSVSILNISLLQYLKPEFRTRSSEALREIVYDSSSEDKKDKFSQEVDDSVGQISKILKDKIK